MTDRLSQISPELRRRLENNHRLNDDVAVLYRNNFILASTLAQFMSWPTKKIIPENLRVRTVFAADRHDFATGSSAQREVLKLMEPIEMEILAELGKVATEKEKRKYRLQK